MTQLVQWLGRSTDDPGSFLGGAQIFLRPPYQKGRGARLSDIMWPRLNDVDHAPLSNTDVKLCGATPPYLHYLNTFMQQCIIKHRDM